MRSIHRPRLRRALLIASVLLGLTATPIVTATSASAQAARWESVCDMYAEYGITAADDSMVHHWWAFGHAHGCW